MPNWHEGSIFISDIFLGGGGGGRSLPKLCNTSMAIFISSLLTGVIDLLTFPTGLGVVEGLV